MAAQFIGKVFIKSCQSMAELPDASIDCVVTSPPYEQMKRYGDSPEDMGNYQGLAFIEKLRPAVREIFRVLKDEGSAFFNFQPSRVGGFMSPTLPALPAMLEQEGLRIVQPITWLKTNAQPTADARLLKSSVETIYHLAKSEAYYADKSATRAPSLWAGRDKRTHKYHPSGLSERGNWFCPALDHVHKLSLQEVLRALLGADSDALPLRKSQDQATIHPAKMPDELADWLILYGSRPGAVVLDPWAGSGTTLCRAKALGRQWVGYELSAGYAELAISRISAVPEAPGEGGGQLGVDPSPTLAAARRGPVTPPSPREALCKHCGKPFPAKRRWQAFCSDRCRYTHHNHANTRAKGG